MLIKKPFKKGMRPSIAPYYKAAAAGTFQGPGDVVSGAIAWGSPARAYSAAFAALAGSIMDIVDSAGANPATINILTTGFVDLATLNAWIVAHGTASVKKLYDQTGAGNFWSTVTVAAMPTITQNALNGLPGLTCAGAVVFPTGNITQGQPFSTSYVSERTGLFTTGQNVLSISGGSFLDGYTTSTNTATCNAGVVLTATASDSAFHAFQAVHNNTSGVLVVDGAATSGSNGANSLAATPLRLASANGAGSGLTGIIMEAGMWNGAFNATQYGNLNTNQHGANGYNF